MEDQTEELETLQALIEMFAVKEKNLVEEAEARKSFNLKLKKLSEAIRLNILSLIYAAQRINTPDEYTEEEREKQKKQKKQEEYYTRAMSKNKLPKISLPDPIEYIPPMKAHAPKSSLYLIIYSLYKSINKAGISKSYKEVSNVLHNFCGFHIEEDSIKREVFRMKKDPYISEFEEFVKRSEDKSA